MEILKMVGNFQAGKIEKGETPEEALIREIKEELDTTINVNKKIVQLNMIILIFIFQWTVLYVTY